MTKERSQSLTTLGVRPQNTMFLSVGQVRPPLLQSGSVHVARIPAAGTFQIFIVCDFRQRKDTGQTLCTSSPKIQGKPLIRPAQVKCYIRGLFPHDRENLNNLLCCIFPTSPDRHPEGDGSRAGPGLSDVRDRMSEILPASHC